MTIITSIYKGNDNDIIYKGNDNNIIYKGEVVRLIIVVVRLIIVVVRLIIEVVRLIIKVVPSTISPLLNTMYDCISGKNLVFSLLDIEAISYSLFSPGIFNFIQLLYYIILYYIIFEITTIYFR
jgi:hypothetical protein